MNVPDVSDSTPPQTKRHLLDSCLYSNKDENMIPATGPLKTDGLRQMIEMSVFCFFSPQKLWAQWEVTCFFLDPVNGIIYTSLNSHACFSLPCPFPPSLSLFSSLFLSRFLGSRQAWPARTVQGISCLSFPSSPPSALHSMGSWSRYLLTGEFPALVM